MISPRRCFACITLLLAILLCPVHAPAQESRWSDLNTRAAELFQQGKYAECLPLLTEALKVAEASFAPDDARIATAAYNLARTYDGLGKASKAEPLYHRALSIQEKALGPEHANLANTLISLGLLYYNQAKYAQAEPLYQRALRIQEKALGPGHADVAVSLYNLAELYDDMGRYTEAEPLYQRALSIREKVLGPDNGDVANILNGLAMLYDHEGKYALAEPLLKRAARIDEKVSGLESPQVATDLSNLGLLYVDQDRYAEAEPLYQRAWRIREKALGPDDPDVANSLINLAQLYEDQGKYAEAEPLYQRGLSIDEKTFGPNHPSLAIDLNNLAGLYEEEGKYDDAQRLYQRALRINQQALGPDNSHVATELSNLGLLYEDQGKYAEAQPLYQRALSIQEKALGPEDHRVATDLNNLGVLYHRQGQYAEAERLFQRALQIDEKAFGPENRAVSTDLNNLALLYSDEQKKAEAEPLYQRALRTDEKTLGGDNPSVAIRLNNLAAFYVGEGKLAEAEPLFQRALRIDKQALGPDQLSVATDLANLGVLYSEQGKPTEAEPLYQQALSIHQKTLGPGHPNVTTDLSNLALLEYEQGSYAQAEPFFRRVQENLFQQFEYNFTYMTEKERLAFLHAVVYYFATYFSFVHRYHEQDPQLAAAMYNLLLWEKSLVVGSVADMRRQVEASGDTEALQLLRQLNAKRTQIAAMQNAQPADRVVWRKQIDQLTVEANDTEKALVARSAVFAEQKKVERATWQEVRDALGPADAAIEFVRFYFYDKKWADSSYYAALVVTRESKDHPQYIFLGNEEQTEGGAIVRLQRAVQTRGSSLEQSPEMPGAQTYDIIWKPLEKALAGKTRIYFSPDGILNQVPLGIVPAPDNKLLMEKYDLRLLSSTRDLLRAAPPPAATTALLVGDPVFDLSETQQLAALQKLALPQPQAPVLMAALSPNELSRDQGNGSVLPRLPGTGAEVTAIAGLMKQHEWKTNVYTNELALKRVVEEASSPRVVHLATHGFFLPDQPIDTGRNRLAENQPVRLDDPMLRSGLFFAGADRALAGKTPPQGLDNGILTAMEASSLNLRGTELVVLSACNTGQGDVRNGEGVFGLRRALQEAGAQSVLMSLWSVPDKETLDLMTRFYTKWLAGTEIHQALREAQLEERAQVRASHGGTDLPYYWGAFVLVGR